MLLMCRVWFGPEHHVRDELNDTTIRRLDAILCQIESGRRRKAEKKPLWLGKVLGERKLSRRKGGKEGSRSFWDILIFGS